MAKLTRTPGMTYGWMVVAIGIVAFLFRQWKLGMAQQRQTLWWTTLVVFLVFDYLFLLLPIRDGASVGAMDVVCLSSRMSTEKLRQELLPLLRLTAERISAGA